MKIAAVFMEAALTKIPVAELKMAARVSDYSVQWDQIYGLREACSSRARFERNLPSRWCSSNALACAVTTCFCRAGQVWEIHSTILKIE